MKMETNVPAPIDGVITAVKVNVGQSLSKDDLIIEIN